MSSHGNPGAEAKRAAAAQAAAERPLRFSEKREIKRQAKHIANTIEVADEAPILASVPLTAEQKVEAEEKRRKKKERREAKRQKAEAEADHRLEDIQRRAAEQIAQQKALAERAQTGRASQNLEKKQ